MTHVRKGAGHHFPDATRNLVESHRTALFLSLSFATAKDPKKRDERGAPVSQFVPRRVRRLRPAGQIVRRSSIQCVSRRGYAFVVAGDLARSIVAAEFEGCDFAVTRRVARGSNLKNSSEPSAPIRGTQGPDGSFRCLGTTAPALGRRDAAARLPRGVQNHSRAMKHRKRRETP